jgi:hypothetical protein
MNAADVLCEGLVAVNQTMHRLAGDLSSRQWQKSAAPSANPVGFIIWHCARNQDWMVNTAIRAKSEVVAEPPWYGTAVATRHGHWIRRASGTRAGRPSEAS